MQEENSKKEIATFAAGCFWSVEAAFRSVKGVRDVVSGYSGGHTDNPSYEEVCSGDTGHAESVQVTFNSNLVSYEQLLGVFWTIHDPTQVNRQGPDVGEQYRSVIFFHTPEQEKMARKSKEMLNKSGRFARPVATAIEPAGEFYSAEEYHQRYLEKHGIATCHI